MKTYLVVLGDYEAHPVASFSEKEKAEALVAFMKNWGEENPRTMTFTSDSFEIPTRAFVSVYKYEGKWKIMLIAPTSKPEETDPFFSAEEAEFEIDIDPTKNKEWHIEKAMNVLRANGCEDDSLAERFGVKED